MKNKLVILSIACAASLPSISYAQSTVTLYGLIDSGLGYVRHSEGTSNLVGMINSNLSGDRWGLKGREDLGGGLAALFEIESGFNVGTGKSSQGGRLFGRTAIIGLTDGNLGTVTVGRQYDPLVDLVQNVTNDDLSSVMGTPGDVDNYDNSARVSNSVKYVSGNYAGLQFEGMYAFGNNAGATGQGQTWSGAVAYTQGPLSLAAGYIYLNNPTSGRFNASTDGSNWGGTASNDSLFDGPINSGYATARSIAIARAGGNYAIGGFKIGASYSNAKYKPDGASAFAQEETYNIGSAFVNYQFSPAFLAGLGYTYNRARGDTSAKYHQIGFGADYFLSKSTDFYFIAAYQHAVGTQAVYNASGQLVTQPAQASIGSFGYAGTNNQELAIVGIRQRF